jgi:hypothetical protein
MGESDGRGFSLNIESAQEVWGALSQKWGDSGLRREFLLEKRSKKPKLIHLIIVIIIIQNIMS